jgi:magnesium-transporting ATPase (P-type)
MDENAFYVPVGNGTEVSLLRWLQGAEIPVHTIIKTKETAALKAQLAFNPAEKISVVAVQFDDKVRVYLKGCPEEVIKYCHHKFLPNGELSDFNHGEKEQVINELMGQSFCKKDGLKCLAFSYADFSIEQFN